MSKAINRRALLRGSGGIALALPWLEVMRPRGAQGATFESPRRLVVWFTANGQNMDVWPPTGGETDFKLSPIMAPLERHRKDLLIPHGLYLAHGSAHTLATTSMLVARPHIRENTVDKSVDISDAGAAATGSSLDQHIARSLKLAEHTRVPTLHLGVQVGKNLMGRYDNVLAWKAAQTPILPQENPYQVFKQLFSDFTGLSATEIDAVRARRRSILDSIKENYAMFASKLGADDKKKVDAHLEAVRQIEKNLENIKDAPGGTCRVPGQGTQIDWTKNNNVPAIGKLQMDLLVAALACDLTRVATLQWAQISACNRSHPWLPGISGSWHGVSHDNGGAAKLAAIGTWYNEQLAYFVDKLKEVKEGDRTLLDNLVVFHTTEYGPNAPDKESHNPIRMPYVLVGSCGGYFKTGRNLPFWTPGTNPYSTRKHNQLLVSLMNAMGVAGDTFGQQSTPGPLPGLRG